MLFMILPLVRIIDLSSREEASVLQWKDENQWPHTVSYQSGEYMSLGVYIRAQK